MATREGSALVDRHDLGLFLLLTFAISWGIWVPVALDGGLQESAEGSPLLLVPALAPAIAAIVLSLLGGGRAGLRRLLSQLGAWRVGLRWYLVALLLPLVLGVAARGLEGLVRGDWEALTDPGLIGLILVGLVPALFIALGQVLGWVGYALPRLQQQFGALAASVILGLAFGVWHVPMWIGWAGVGMVPTALGSAVAMFVFFAWILNSSASLPMVWLFHAVTNATDPLSDPDSLFDPAVTIAVGVLVVVLAGPAHLARTRTRRRQSDLASPSRAGRSDGGDRPPAKVATRAVGRSE